MWIKIFKYLSNLYSFNSYYHIIKLGTYLVLWLNVELLHHLDGEPDGVLIVAGHHDTNSLWKNQLRQLSNYNLQKTQIYQH